MSYVQAKKNKIISTVKSELCQMDLRSVIIGAVLTLLIGFLSSLIGGSREAFEEAVKPKGVPPTFLFPIIWTVLYILIGSAAGAVWSVKDKALQEAKFRSLFSFILMMVFNFIWYPLFFGASAYLSAFLAILAMLILSFFTAFRFWNIFKVCGAAIGVYILWLLYAAYLNFGVLILN